MSINLLSFSQENTITVKTKNDDSVKFRLFIPTISLIGNYPLIHSNEYSGIIDFNFQLNLTNNTKLKRWVFGTNLNYFVFKNQNLNNSDLFKISLNIEYDFREIGPLLGLKFAGDIGYYNEKLKNGLSYGFGLVFDRMIFNKTQLLINLKENILVGHFNYLNFGVGFRRFIYYN